jgi:cytochrome c-type biogenesis protein CcmH
LIFLLLTAPLSLAADRERVKEIGNKLICTCGGCNQLLGICTHLGCPNSGPMREELAEMLDAGKSEAEILAAFAEKYGDHVLAAPPASGFNLTAWIMPFAALAVGSLVVVHFVRRWRARWQEAPAAPALDTLKYQQRLEEELKKYTPED